MDKSLREQVWERCNGYCEKCGKPLSPLSWALHHRKLRSQGGKDAVENLLALHHACHNTGTKSVHLNPAMSMQSGHIVPRHAEPHEYELTLPNGDRVTLTPEGTYNTVRKAGSGGW